MPYKDNEKQKEHYRRHYRNNKPLYYEKAKRRRLAIRLEVQRIKESSPCTDCKLFFPYYVMDFDHKGDKIAGVPVLITRGYRIAVLKEIAKCDLVCSNCHRIRTFERKAS